MFEKQMKQIDVWDISLIKLTTAAFILFLITIIPSLMDVVVKVGPWWFLGIAIVALLRPGYRFWLKK